MTEQYCETCMQPLHNPILNAEELQKYFAPVTEFFFCYHHWLGLLASTHSELINFEIWGVGKIPRTGG
jgi:hypothetical protein